MLSWLSSLSHTNAAATQGYDISFLITNFHCEDMYKHKLVEFVIHFMKDVDKEISDMKLVSSAPSMSMCLTSR